MIPRSYQQRAIDELWSWWERNETGNPLVVAPTGCHARGTTVLMHDGARKAVEDVRVGDVLCGPDGSPRNVLKLVHGREQLYRITPHRGTDAFVVNESHVLSLKTTNEGKQYGVDGGSVENVTLRDYLGKSKHWRHVRKLHRSEAVEFASDVGAPPFDPWALGALLGDGSIVRTLMFVNPDIDVLNAMLDAMRRYGCDVSQKSKAKNGCWHASFIHPENLGGLKRKNPVTEILRGLNLFGCKSEDKFVPDQFLRGSVRTRLAVIAGLLDTDGHHDGLGGFDFISKSERLANDLVFMARSVGITASMRACEQYCQTGAGGTYHRVHLSGHTERLPIVCERKRPPVRSTKKSPHVTGFEVEPIGVGEFFGFTLDNDHLYLTADFMVHHNSGKSLLLAMAVQRAIADYPEHDVRVLVIAPSRELVEQNVEKLLAVWPGAPVGIVSASLGRREMGRAITYGTIGSLHRVFQSLGRIDLIFIDEAHLIQRSRTGMYRTLIERLAARSPVRVVGMTATPFRGDGVWLTDSDEALFSSIATQITIRELLDANYIAPLIAPKVEQLIDTDNVSTSAGDFNLGELALASNTDEINRQVVRDVISHGKGRCSWIGFCVTISHAESIAQEFRAAGIDCAAVHGDLAAQERAALITRFRAGELRCLVTVLALLTGFDAPNVDLIFWLRSTKSPVLWIQGLGRGLRIAPGKSDCVVLDFTDTTARLGPIDEITGRNARPASHDELPYKLCPICKTRCHTTAPHCSACGHVFPPPERQAKRFEVAGLAVMNRSRTPESVVVTDVQYSRHVGASGKETLRVDYFNRMRRRFASEFVALDHEGFARRKAEAWWRDRSDAPPPRSVAEAYESNAIEPLRRPARICVMPNPEKPKVMMIVRHEWMAEESAE